MSTVNFNEIIANLDKSLLVSNSGQRKENIYKKDIFADCITDRDKKTRRRKLRNILESFISSFILTKEEAKLKKLSLSFDAYYKATYVTNDYSLESLISANTDAAKKDNLSKMLEIAKKNLSTNEKKK
ncbi:MAG: hypothetical protein RSC49_04670 [Clostridium sp.]